MEEELAVIPSNGTTIWDNKMLIITYKGKVIDRDMKGKQNERKDETKTTDGLVFYVCWCVVLRLFQIIHVMSCLRMS